MGYSRHDIMIDVLLTHGHEIEYKDEHGLGAINSYFRYSHIYNFYAQVNGLKRAMHALPEVDFRYLIGPSKELSKKTLEVRASQSEIDTFVKQGYEDAKELLIATSQPRVLLDKF